MLARDGSYAKVWKVPGETEATVVSQGNDTKPYEPFFFIKKKKKQNKKIQNKTQLGYTHIKLYLLRMMNFEVKFS